jgi:HAD superfamily 5'-nucleotidase-like hydrolase
LVDLSEERWVFLNTLFSHSEACIYAQLVDKLDEGKIPEILNYNDLYTTVRQNLDQTHLEGLLKAEIISKPQNFITHDPDLPQTLLDLFHSGKKLLLITNSDWNYTKSMMSFILDNFLPDKMKWRDLFDVIIISEVLEHLSKNAIF